MPARSSTLVVDLSWLQEPPAVSVVRLFVLLPFAVRASRLPTFQEKDWKLSARD